MRDVWVRQVAECYAAAAQQGDKGALERLGLWRAALAKDQPAGTLTGYLVYREMTAEYGQKLLVGDLKDKDIQKLQEGWTKLLEKFIADYPSADDAPDALMQLGMVSEFMGKEAKIVGLAPSEKSPSRPSLATVSASAVLPWRDRIIASVAKACARAGGATQRSSAEARASRSAASSSPISR